MRSIYILALKREHAADHLKKATSLESQAPSTVATVYSEGQPTASVSYHLAGLMGQQAEDLEHALKSLRECYKHLHELFRTGSSDGLILSVERCQEHLQNVEVKIGDYLHTISLALSDVVAMEKAARWIQIKSGVMRFFLRFMGVTWSEAKKKADLVY